jgi:trehalose 2-sulfotransferase
MMLTYLIASLPRTGSYLLGESLSATGIAGNPTEPFSPEFRPEFCRRWGLRLDATFEEYLSAVFRNGTTGNGVFGVKLHWNQVEWLIRENGIGSDNLDILEHLFPGAKYVQLTRRGQAISLYRAFATNEWWRIAGVLNPQITGSDPEFDAQAIRQLERSLIDKRMKGFPGNDYGFVTVFDALHDMGDPVGAASPQEA